MNVLLLGPMFQNQDHGAEVGVFEAFMELGHNITVWDYRANKIGNCKSDKVLTNEGVLLQKWDLVLSLGAGLPDNVLGSDVWKFIKEQECPRVCWNSEPVKLKQYKDKVTKQIGEFTHWFTFDETEVGLYRTLTKNPVHWMPQAFNPRWYRPVKYREADYKNSLIFVGSLGGKWRNRTKFLERIGNNYSIDVIQNFHAPSVNYLYNTHRAVLNLGLQLSNDPYKGSGLQQRIFEAIGSTQVVITNEIYGNRLFEHGKNILFYNRRNLTEIIDMTFDADLMQQMHINIGNIRQYHTYENRITRILETLSRKQVKHEVRS